MESSYSKVQDCTLLIDRVSSIQCEQLQNKCVNKISNKRSNDIRNANQSTAKSSQIVKILHEKKSNQKLIPLNVKSGSDTPNDIKFNNKKTMKMNQKRKPIKVNAPAPVKNGKNIGERVAKEKPLIARRLIGNSSNSNENGAKSLSFNSKSASPAASFRGARASGSKTDGKRNESPSHRCKLLELTNERHLSRPVYQSYTTTSKHRSVAIYLSRVTVDGQYWSSHPTAVSSPDDAEELAAKKAYVELSRRWSRRQLGDNLHTQSSVERKALIDQIVSIVRSEPFHVLFSTAIPDKYFKQHKQPIPQNWLEIVQQFPRDLQIEKLIFSNTIRINIGIPTAAALKQLDEQNEDKSIDDDSNQVKQPAIEAQQNELSNDLDRMVLNADSTTNANGSSVQLLPPNLELPSSQYWNVLLLEAKNNREIIMRLADTSEQYLDFLDRLCSLYTPDDAKSTNETKPVGQVSQVVSGRIYAAVFNGCTLRVQALESDSTNESNDRTVSCMYVDEAGLERIPVASLREIPDDLLRLPFQAFSVGLANLKAYEHDERVADLLQKMIQEADSGLVLVAEPVSRFDPIRVLLYDTSGSDDIVLNDLLREMVINLDHLGVQQLPPPDPAAVTITNGKNNHNEDAIKSSTLDSAQNVDQSTSNGNAEADLNAQQTIQLDLKEDSSAIKAKTDDSATDLSSLKPLPAELCGAQSIPPAQLPEVNPKPTCSEEFWYVALSVPVSPNNFVLHERSLDSDQPTPYDRLCREMQELYDEEEPIELHGSLILARQLLAIKDQDDKWKRARVQAILSLEPDFSVLVQLLDEGGVRVLGLAQVQPLYSQFAQLPIQAMRASLCDVQPLDTDWSPLAVYQFGQLVQHQQFRAVVHQVMQVDGEPLLQVTLYRQSDGSSISNDLVRLNLAKSV